MHYNDPARILIGFGAIAMAVNAPPAVAQFAEPDVSVLYTLTSGEANDQFGWAADAIGDLNGDGASEVIIGAPSNTGGGPSAGAAFVYSGRDGTLINTITGSAFDRLGNGVAGVGDVNADGVPDYAASGPGAFGISPPPQLGRLLVVSGATHTILIDRSGPAPFSGFGWDIGAAGDVNGDSYDDIIVGAPFHFLAGPFSGSVHLISGQDGATIRVTAGPVGSSFGTAVSRVDDQDGDGRADHAVGGRSGGSKQTGEAYVLSGTDGSVIRVLKAKQNTGVQFGNFFVHDAGDIDADGRGDIFVGDFADTGGGPFAGLGYVFYGGRDDRRFFFPDEPAGGLGPGRGAGDVDGDGHDDIVMAAFLSTAAATAGGKMYVFSGRNGKVIRTMTGDMAGEQLGFDALAVGDVNGDGRIDFLITGVRTAHLILGNP
jgi:hypothetical protein